MRDKMNFVICAPSVGNTFWETVDFTNFVLNLTQVSWLVNSLMRRMLCIEMSVTINCSRQARPVIYYLSLSLEIDDSNKLLIQLASSVVQAMQRSHISLIYIMMFNDVWVGHVGPVVAPDRSLVRSPACKTVNQYHWVVV